MARRTMMSWRNRKQDVYTNHGKETTTTITPADAPEYWRVTQFKKYMGQQVEMTFEGVFREDDAEERFVLLVDEAHQETVLAPGTGKVLVGVIDGEDDA
jgi:hypothetical protein